MSSGSAKPGRRLVLQRHGRTAWNDTGRAQGQADVPLDETGHRQAAAAAPYLASLAPVALWSSDLARAAQTCGYLEQETGLSAKHDARLREFDVGVRQGMTLAQFAEAFPAEHAAWLQEDPSLRLPGAEIHAEVEERIVPALVECLESLAPGETAVVVSHGASLKVAVAGLLGWPAGMHRTFRGLDNCAWATLEEVEAGGRLRLVGYNESVVPGHDAPRTL